jgi:ElaB/YqjD/DUF883 family membrane-anchored ribosome-binding protein
MDSTQKLNELFTQTEKLLAKLADDGRADVQEIRDRLNKSMARTKGSLQQGSSKRGSPQQAPRRQRVKVRDVVSSFNDYVQNHPWMALATGVLLASTIGILSTNATKRSLHP